MQQQLAALRWFFVQWEVRSFSPHWLVRAEAKWSLCWFWARNRSLCLFFFFGSLDRCFPVPPGNKKKRNGYPFSQYYPNLLDVKDILFSVMWSVSLANGTWRQWVDYQRNKVANWPGPPDEEGPRRPKIVCVAITLW